MVIQMEDFPPRLEELRKIADRKASDNRDIRDGLNVKMKEHIGTRNEFNTEAVSYTHLTLPTICSV